MALNLNYQDFFRSSFLVEYRKLGLSTNDFLSFANSLIGVENFIRNHPIPILEYYWVCNGGMNKLVESIANRLGICLKKIKVVSSEKMLIMLIKMFIIFFLNILILCLIV